MLQAGKGEVLNIFRTENFVSDLQRPIYNKIFDLQVLKKILPDEIPTLLVPNLTENQLICCCLGRNEVDRNILIN